MNDREKQDPSVTEESYAVASNLVDLLEHLDRHGRVSVNSIQKRCSVGRGAAKRYLAFLKQRRPLVSRMQGKEKFWRLEVGSPATRSVDEVAALELSLRSAQWLLGTPYYDLLAAQLDSQREQLDPDLHDKLQTFVRSFVHRTQGDASYAGKQPQLDALLRGIRERRPCEITYRRPDGAIGEYRVEPLLLVLYKDRLYLLARKARERLRRTFVVDSIESVRVDLDARKFSLSNPRLTEPEHVFRSSFGVFTDCGSPVEVEIEVQGAAAAAVQRRPLHSSQRVSDLGSGRFVVRWTVANCPELRSFVLSLLPEVRVRRPEELRRQIADAARAALDPDADVGR